MHEILCGFFAMPGRVGVPDLPSSRTIPVEYKAEIQKLPDQDQFLALWLLP
jgi:hypothetical protein